MGWTRLEPPQRKERHRRLGEALRITLRKLKAGMTMRLALGSPVGEALRIKDAGWCVGGRVEVCIGGGADRGQLRLMPAQDGDFTLRDGNGRGKGKGGLRLVLPPNVAWADDVGTWKLPLEATEISDAGVLTVTLPEAVLSAKAHALPMRKAS